MKISQKKEKLYWAFLDGRAGDGGWPRAAGGGQEDRTPLWIQVKDRAGQDNRTPLWIQVEDRAGQEDMTHLWIQVEDRAGHGGQDSSMDKVRG